MNEWMKKLEDIAEQTKQVCDIIKKYLILLTYSNQSSWLRIQLVEYNAWAKLVTVDWGNRRKKPNCIHQLVEIQIYLQSFATSEQIYR